MLNRAIIDDYRLEQNPAPPENFRFADPSEIHVRTAVPKWTWIARVCSDIPVGKVVLLPVPEGMGIDKFINNLRSSLAQSKESNRGRFSIRRSKFEDYAVVMKSGIWREKYRQMESEAAA